MITAEKCRIRATECKTFASSIDISTQQSLEQSIMALNWEALADQVDEDNSQATEARLVAGANRKGRKHGIDGVAMSA
jgi:hypothetical protein